MEAPRPHPQTRGAATAKPPAELNRAMSMTLDRCIALGVPACTFDASARMVASSDQAPGMREWLRSTMMVSAMTGLVRAHPAGNSKPELHEPVADLPMAVIRHTEGASVLGFTVCLFPGPAALKGPAFAFVCRESGHKVGELRRGLAPLAVFDAASALAVSRAVRLAATDFQTLDEQTVAIDGFTNHLTDAYDTMDLLYTMGRSMKAPFDPKRFIASMCERLHATMSFRWVAVRFSPDFAVTDGLRDRFYFSGDLPMARDRLALAIAPLMAQATGQPTVSSTLAGFDGDQLLSQAVYCKGVPIGMVVVGGKHGADPAVSSYDIQLVEAAAGFLNAFADNVALYEDQHSLFVGTVQALTAAIDAKDRYTCGHSERVAYLGHRLALSLGMAPDEAERIRICGLVHDVGKIGVPESVLTKPGRLTEAEFALIKRHPEIGHRILKDIPQLEDILPGVLHHHERLDGNGYPGHLAGEEIPMIARVLAVADTFDAMSSDRSYRRAKLRNEVIAEIEACAGTQFDPNVARMVRGLDFAEYDRMVARHAAGQVGLAA